MRKDDIINNFNLLNGTKLFDSSRQKVYVPKKKNTKAKKKSDHITEEEFEKLKFLQKEMQIKKLQKIKETFNELNKIKLPKPNKKLFK